MEVLASSGGAELIRAELEAIDHVLSMMDDGSIVSSDGSVERDPRPEVAWLTPDVLWNRPLARRLLDILLNSSSLRWVQTAAAGSDTVGVSSLLKRGVRVTNAHVNAISIAEFVFAMVLEHFQGLARRRAHQEARSWKPEPFREIFGTTWMIVGLGAIGSEVARRASAFGAQVIGVRRAPTGEEPVDELLHADELTNHIHIADVIVLAVPGTPSTAHLVDRELLGRTKSDAVLVNVSRGSVVDAGALATSLDEGRPGLAILDVLVDEPLPPDDPLWVHPRVRLTFHGAALGNGRIQRGTELFLENLLRYRRGDPLLNELTPTDISHPPSQSTRVHR